VGWFLGSDFLLLQREKDLDNPLAQPWTWFSFHDGLNYAASLAHIKTDLIIDIGRESRRIGKIGDKRFE